MRIDRRSFAFGTLAVLSAPARAQTGHAGHGLYESLREPGRIGLPEVAKIQRVTDSPAPRAENQGRWTPRAALPLPRSEMA